MRGNALLVAFLCVPALLCLPTGCASSGTRDPLSHDKPLRVMPVTNLAGVSLNVPELYLGDAGGVPPGLDVEMIDLRVLCRAALLSRLRALGYMAGLDTGSYEMHGAVTYFDMTELRATGRIEAGLTLMLVDPVTDRVIRRGAARQSYQLLSEAPDRTGALGEQRFIRERLGAFIEGLCGEALRALGA